MFLRIYMAFWSWCIILKRHNAVILLIYFKSKILTLPQNSEFWMNDDETFQFSNVLKKIISCLPDVTAAKCHSINPFLAALIHQCNTSHIGVVLSELASQGHQWFRSCSISNLINSQLVTPVYVLNVLEKEQHKTEDYEGTDWLLKSNALMSSLGKRLLISEQYTAKEHPSRPCFREVTSW